MPPIYFCGIWIQFCETRKPYYSLPHFLVVVESSLQNPWKGSWKLLYCEITEQLGRCNYSDHQDLTGCKMVVEQCLLYIEFQF